MPNRTEARPAKAEHTNATGDYRYCACSRLYSLLWKIDMKSSYWRWLLIWVALGLFIPTCWFLAQWLSPDHALSRASLYLLERVARVLWPSSIWLLATDGSEESLSSYAVVAISVAVTIMLYAAIGSGLWLLRWRIVRRPQ
jgi:hypothetical protein